MKSNSAAILLATVALVAIIGFYPTYISQYPEFNGLETAHHFHGFMMMTWFVLLIVQPLLITYRKTNIHKLLGKVSYVIAPFVVVSIFIVTKLEYYDDAAIYTRERTLAGLILI